jgi:hypothetical protein
MIALFRSEATRQSRDRRGATEESFSRTGFAPGPLDRRVAAARLLATTALRADANN